MTEQTVAVNQPRGWMVFLITSALGFAASLLVGIVFDAILSKDTMSAVAEAQLAACEAVSNLGPLPLADRVAVLATGMTLGGKEVYDLDDYNLEKNPPSCSAILRDAVWPFDQTVPHLESEETTNWATKVPVQLRLPVAVAQAGWEAIVQPSWLGRIIAVLILVVGFLITAMAMNNMKDPGLLGFAVLLPLGTIVFGSLFAYGLQVLLLAILWLTSGFTETAMTASVSSGFGGFCYWLIVKYLGRAADNAVARMIEG